MKKYIFAILIIVVIGIGLYLPALQHSFHFDDYIFIVENDGIRDLDFSQLWGGAGHPTRFLGYFTFALNYHWHKLEVSGFRLVNILIHACNGLWVFGIIQYLGRSPRVASQHLRYNFFAMGLIGALLFVTHPIQTQAVTYICQRFASLATFFYLGSVCLFSAARTSSNKNSSYFFLGSVFLGGCAMFTKQIALTLPVMIFLTEIYFFRTKPLAQLMNRKFFLRFVLPGILFCLIIPVLYQFKAANIVLIEVPSWSHQGDVLTSMSYWRTQIWVIPTYIKLLIFPIGQNLVYDFPMAPEGFHWITFGYLLFLLGLMFLAVYLFQTNILISFGIIWFFVALAVESSIIPIRHVIFEHRCYLPFFGFALIVAASLSQFISDGKKRYVVAGIIVCTWMFLTFQRNQIWKDTISLWSDVMEKAPTQLRSYQHRGMAYLQKGQRDLALKDFHQAIVVDPDDGESYTNRGNAWMALKEYEKAMADFKKAIELDPTLARAYNNIGVMYKMQKDFDQALDYFDKAIEAKSSNAASYYNRANIYIGQRNLELALENYTQTLKYNPRHTKARLKRSKVLFELGRYKEAYEEALRAKEDGVIIKPDYWLLLQRTVVLEGVNDSISD